MTTTSPPPPKDIGFNFAVDRQAIQQLLVLVQQAIALKTTGITVCITSTGGATEQAF